MTLQGFTAVNFYQNTPCNILEESHIRMYHGLLQIEKFVVFEESEKKARDM
jgi:hypothetical protein